MNKEYKTVEERSKEIAMSITDDEIRAIIKEELIRQIRREVKFGTVINDWIELWLEDEDNCEFVMNCIRKSIKKKFQ